jgi:S-adenosylmethionine:tRNA ribosyltransferase-isomerase
MNIDELDFHLPPELIAQTPAADRAASRLLHYRRDTREIAHRTFADLPSLLRPGDLMVFNNTRVAPVRFTLQKPTGGIVDGLLVGPAGEGRLRAMLRNLGAVHPDVPLRFIGAPAAAAYVIGKTNDGEYLVRIDGIDESPWVFLERVGRMPLPPYIRRRRVHDDRDSLDRERYQTVYARPDVTEGQASIAAPTAGLHFTPQLLQQIDAMGVERAFVTLQVGLGTFKPVTADRVEDHTMHAEAYTIPAAAADALNRAKQARRRIVAVGTTSARVLESHPTDQPFTETYDETSVFIYPPYQWRHVGALITNFHLPRSTLVALVAAMVGLDEQRRIYAAAVEPRYRFFSYGDAMLIA